MVACQALAQDLLKELQAWKHSQFAEWSGDTHDKLSSIRMDQSGRLMDMGSRDGRIELHYNDELVTMLREVSRQAPYLVALGLLQSASVSVLHLCNWPACTAKRPQNDRFGKKHFSFMHLAITKFASCYSSRVHNHCTAYLCWTLSQVGQYMQVRQLQSIGFTVGKDILAEVDTANKFYRHGLLMKQVVNFYNNSATEMIPCQKPMLLQVRLMSVACNA